VPGLRKYSSVSHQEVWSRRLSFPATSMVITDADAASGRAQALVVAGFQATSTPFGTEPVVAAYELGSGQVRYAPKAPWPSYEDPMDIPVYSGLIAPANDDGVYFTGVWSCTGSAWPRCSCALVPNGTTHK
jgi:hypothetical protein